MPRLYNLTPLLIIRVSDPVPERFIGQIEWMREIGEIGDTSTSLGVSDEGDRGDEVKSGKLEVSSFQAFI